MIFDYYEYNYKKAEEGWAMKRVLALLAGVSLLSFSPVQGNATTQ
jgi:hypothetical protein